MNTFYHNPLKQILQINEFIYYKDEEFNQNALIAVKCILLLIDY